MSEDGTSDRSDTASASTATSRPHQLAPVHPCLPPMELGTVLTSMPSPAGPGATPCHCTKDVTEEADPGRLQTWSPWVSGPRSRAMRGWIWAPTTTEEGFQRT